MTLQSHSWAYSQRKTWSKGSCTLMYTVALSSMAKTWKQPKRPLTKEWINKIGLLLLLSLFSRVQLCATPEMAAHQAPPSLGFSRQEYWSGLPFPSPMHEGEK